MCRIRPYNGGSAMGRKASIRSKNGYWYSEAGGVGRYFGKVDEVTHEQAMALMGAALRNPVGSVVEPLTVDELCSRFLDWVGRYRSDRVRVEDTRHLARFRRLYGRLQATAVTAKHLEQFQDRLAAKFAPMYVKKHSGTVRAAYNRGRRASWIPPDCRPFANLEHIRIEPKPILEGDLPSDDEVKRLFAKAEGVMLDLLTLYHATGARTSEILDALVGDFQRQSRTIVLGRHKRSHTMRSPIPRTITLNEDAYAVLVRLAHGKPDTAHLVVSGGGSPYDTCTFGNRFATLRRQAGVRPLITAYSFRHLWVSEALMAGLDSLIVAKMAGTSVSMVEKTYGHFRLTSFKDAQARLDAARKGRG